MPTPPTEKELHEMCVENRDVEDALGLHPCTGQFRYLWITCPESESGGYFMCWRDFR